jgi:photoactive yellow protein
MFSTVLPGFADAGLLEWLEAATPAARDALAFGLVSLSADGMVTHYNLAEAGFSGLTPARLVGRHFFTTVATCGNNAMVAGRFETAAALDVSLDYVFAFKVVPTPVRLRLLKRAGPGPHYLAVRVGV